MMTIVRKGYVGNIVVRDTPTGNMDNSTPIDKIGNNSGDSTYNGVASIGSIGFGHVQ